MVASSMNSKARILNSIRHQPVDHPPLWLRFWPLGNVDRIPLPWRDQVRRAENLQTLGIDDVLMLEPPLGYVENYQPIQLPGLSSQVSLIPASSDSQNPQLIKEYTTPRGILRTVVQKTEDWPHGDEVYLFDDFNVSRSIEPLIKQHQDISQLRYLLADPTPEQSAYFLDEADKLKGQADRLGVALEGGMTALGDAAVWLCGMSRVLLAQMDEPDFIEELLDILLDWELKRVEWLVEAGIDFLTHMAWYEGTDFWTPKNYRLLLKPRLKKLIDKVHAHGIPFRYILTKGGQPLWQDFLDLGIDCLSGIDPLQDRVDLREIKNRLGKNICLMGGVNAAVTLTQWSDDEIRQAVDEAMRILSTDSGFILYPVDAIFSNFDWSKVLVLIHQWQTLC